MDTKTQSDVLIKALLSGDVRKRYLALKYFNAPFDPLDIQAGEELLVCAAAYGSSDQMVLGAVARCLRSDNSDIRVEAAKALGRIGEKALPHIYVFLLDKTLALDFRVGTVVNLLSRTGLEGAEANKLIEFLKRPEMKDVYEGFKKFMQGTILINPKG